MFLSNFCSLLASVFLLAGVRGGGTTTTPRIGQFMYQKYSDAACTVPVDNHLAGPLYACIDTAVTGMGFTDGFGPAARVDKVSNDMLSVHFYAGHECPGTSTLSLSLTVGACTAAGGGGFYLVYDAATEFKGYFQYRRFTDSSCTATMPTSDTRYNEWEGLIEECMDTAQYFVSWSKRWASITGCGTGTIVIWEPAMERDPPNNCHGLLHQNHFVEGACSWGGFGGYYLATCVTPLQALSSSSTTTLSPTSTSTSTSTTTLSTTTSTSTLSTTTLRQTPSTSTSTKLSRTSTSTSTSTTCTRTSSASQTATTEAVTGASNTETASTAAGQSNHEELEQTRDFTDSVGDPLPPTPDQVHQSEVTPSSPIGATISSTSAAEKSIGRIASFAVLSSGMLMLQMQSIW